MSFREMCRNNADHWRDVAKEKERPSPLHHQPPSSFGYDYSSSFLPMPASPLSKPAVTGRYSYDYSKSFLPMPGIWS